MILRNSKNSILRMPLKTALFTLLIVAVTAFLYLGVNTWASSIRMLRDCDENYTTIASIEYLGEHYPNESIYDAAMLRDVDGIDFSALQNDPRVLRWQPVDCSIGLLDGFISHTSSVPYLYSNVLVITEARQYQQEGVYYAKAVDCLYSYRPDIEGKHFFLYTDGYDFQPDPSAFYVIHGQAENLSSGMLSIHLSAFSSYAAALAGVDCAAIAPCMEVASADAVSADPDSIYLSMADYYNVMNNKVYVYRTEEPAELDEFHQERLRLLSGRLFTPEEAAAGAKVCVLSETLAKDRNLSVGDRVTLRTTDNTGLPAADCYWGVGSMTQEDEYELIGIFNYYEGLQTNVYIPAVPDSAKPEKYVYKLGSATLKNGTADAFLSDLQAQLPARVSIDIYDQGYQTTANSLAVIRSASAALSVVAFLASLAVLLFFAFLFVEKQHDTVETMRCFGTTRAETRLYLLFGAGLIAFFAVFAGILLGTRYASALISRAYTFISELQAVDFRYSNGYLGLVKDFTPVPVASVPLAVATGATVFLLALGFCLYFAERTISGRVMQVKTRTQNRRPPKCSSTAGSGALRYTMLSLRRSGARTLVVPVLSAVMLFFLTTLLATSSSYETARETLYDTTVLRGYFTTMTGKYAGNLLIRNNQAQRFLDTGFLDEASLTYHKPYGYLGVVRRADGSTGNVADVPYPKDSYTLTNLLNQLANAPFLVFTNAVADAPEFYFSQFTGDFLPGWSAASFTERDWETPFCAVSTQFMASEGVRLGDTIRVYVGNGTGLSPSGVDDPPFLGVEMLVVGSFYKQGSEDNIYCPLSAGVLRLSDLSVKRPSSSDWSFGYLRWRVEDVAALPPQQLIDILLDESYVASCSFTLRDARQLSAFKDALAEIGFSGPKQENSIRVAVMLEDADFLESVSSIAQRSRYMEILYPVLLALVAAVGAITSYLMVNSRRGEIAVMRGLGTPKRRIFTVFFAEQLLLLLAGTALAAAGWTVFSGAALLRLPDPYTFFLCYTLGAAVSLFVQNGKRALYILSEKE